MVHDTSCVMRKRKHLYHILDLNPLKVEELLNFCCLIPLIEAYICFYRSRTVTEILCLANNRGNSSCLPCSGCMYILYNPPFTSLTLSMSHTKLARGCNDSGKCGLATAWIWVVNTQMSWLILLQLCPMPFWMTENILKLGTGLLKM